jgi:hypothetical protein
VLAICVAAVATSFGGAASQAATSAPPFLPGPPPQAGAQIASPPTATTMPVAGPVGPATSIPTRIGAPGLLSGTAQLHGRQLTLALACPTDGRASITDAAIRRGVLAHAGYSCKGRRANVQLLLRAADVRRLRQLGPTLAQVTLGRGGQIGQFSLTLAAKPAPLSFWSDGGLNCSLLGNYTPYLVAPTFTVNPPAIIDVRPWVAFYTSANGWQWLGTDGLNRSTWYRWTDSAGGPLQWKTPTGAVNPWTWAPIGVSPGHGTYAIGAFEVVYWFAHSHNDVWKLAPSHPSESVRGTYCSFP